MDRLENIPAHILSDPRHLIPECDSCAHCAPEGLCGLGLHPTDAWAQPSGCREYAPLALEGGGDPSGDDL